MILPAVIWVPQYVHSVLDGRTDGRTGQFVCISTGLLVDLIMVWMYSRRGTAVAIFRIRLHDRVDFFNIQCRVSWRESQASTFRFSGWEKSCHDVFLHAYQALAAGDGPKYPHLLTVHCSRYLIRKLN